jgi:hypothetical protein
MADPLATALAAQFAGPHAVAARYTPPGAGSPVAVRAIRNSDPAERLSAAGGNPLVGVNFEIQKAELPAKPATGGVIEVLDAAGATVSKWTVRAARDLDFVPVWEVTVEQAA